MSERTLNLTPILYDYYLTNSLREPEILRQLRQRTQTLRMHQMQISPEQGQFMRFLVELMQAKKTIDIGTFTGYSALTVALGLPDRGKVIACDINEEWTAIAKEFWQQAGVKHKIDLRIAPAEKTLNDLIAAGEAGTFDFIFIDADKSNYSLYYQLSLQLLRVGGVIAVDNVLWNGKVADSNVNDTQTRAIRTFNKQVHEDTRVFISMLPIGDGMTLIRKL